MRETKLNLRPEYYTLLFSNSSVSMTRDNSSLVLVNEKNVSESEVCSTRRISEKHSEVGGLALVTLRAAGSADKVNRSIMDWLSSSYRLCNDFPMAFPFFS